MAELGRFSLPRLAVMAVVGFLMGMLMVPSTTNAQTGCSTRTDYGTSGDDRLVGGDTTQDTLWGYDGNDEILGYNCNDSLHGGGAGDNIHGATGADTIYGGAGSEYYTVCGNYACGEIVGGNGNDYVEAGDGDDYVYSNSNTSDSDEFRGEGGDFDFVDVGDTDTADRVYGGQGNDDDCYFDYYQNTSSPDYVDSSCENLGPS